MSVEIAFCLAVGLRLSWEDGRKLDIPLAETLLYLSFALFWRPSSAVSILFWVILAVFARIFPLGVGEGDFVLLAIWRIAFSNLELNYILFLGTFLGLLFEGAYYLLKKKVYEPLPFIPFLTTSLLIYFIFFQRFFEKI